MQLDLENSNLKIVKMADEIKVAEIKKFNGTDFGYWKIQIEDYLYEKKLHLPLMGSKPNNMEEEWLILKLALKINHIIERELRRMGF